MSSSWKYKHRGDTWRVPVVTFPPDTDLKVPSSYKEDDEEIPNETPPRGMADCEEVLVPNEYEIPSGVPNHYEEIASGGTDGAHAELLLKEHHNVYQDLQKPKEKRPMPMDKESAGITDGASCGQNSGHNSGYTPVPCALNPGIQYPHIDSTEEAENAGDLESHLPYFGDCELQPLHPDSAALLINDNEVNDNRRQNVSATLCHQNEDPQTLTVTLLSMETGDDEEAVGGESEISAGSTEECTSLFEHRKENGTDSDEDEENKGYAKCKLEL